MITKTGFWAQKCDIYGGHRIRVPSALASDPTKEFYKAMVSSFLLNLWHEVEDANLCDNYHFKAKKFTYIAAPENQEEESFLLTSLQSPTEVNRSAVIMLKMGPIKHMYPSTMPIREGVMLMQGIPKTEIRANYIYQYLIFMTLRLVGVRDFGTSSERIPDMFGRRV